MVASKFLIKDSAITYDKQRIDFPFIFEFSNRHVVVRKETETENSQNQNKKRRLTPNSET